MKEKLFSLFLFFFSGFVLNGQPPETTYLGNPIISGFNQDIPPAKFGPYSIGFNFTFFGKVVPETQFWVSANGLVLFSPPTDSYASETTIPLASAPNNFIAPFWDNLSISESGSVMYKTIGSAGSRKCIIQYKNMGFDPILSPFGTFTIILYETSNVIQVQYRLIQNPYSGSCHGESATIGLENADGTAGVLYKYRDANAVHTEDAISFTPSAGTYTINADATYDGVFLTTNTTLPDPSICTLISPSSDAITGTSQTFEWSAATNATKYYIAVDVNPDLMSARFHNAGTNLTYDTVGLSLGQTYYWAVFSINATATTWGEVKRFTTSSTPPLTAVPRTLWVSQGEERNIKLQFTGGDASMKSAIVTSLPSQGQLWQVSGGVKTTQITTFPETVTDPGFNLIYVANGSTGNNAGTFHLKFHDDTGDSPETAYTINVNPPGIPNLLTTAKSTTVELQFDRKMNSPSGKESQFAVKVNGTPVNVSSASLKTNDPYSVILSLSTPLAGGETVLVSYTKGTVSATTGGLLESFTDEPVTLTAQNITFSTNLTKQYGNPAFSLSASSSSGLTAFTYSSSDFSIATISGSTVTIRGVGSCEIKALQAGNATYAPAKSVRTLTVSKGNQIITFGSLAAKAYGDASFALGATSNSGLAVSYTSATTSVATVSGNIVTITGVGASDITASQAGNSLWNAATPVIQTLNVSKGNQTITFGPLAPKSYGDADFAVTATASSGLTVDFNSSITSVATVAGNIIHIEGSGDSDITASQPGNSLWNAATPVIQTLNVSKADQTISFGTLASKSYGDIDFDLSATSGSGLPVTFSSSDPGVASITGTTVCILKAGTCTITASQAGDDNWNPAVSVDQLFDISKAYQTITFPSLSPKEPTDPDFDPGASSSSGLTVTYSSNKPSVAIIAGNLIHLTGEGIALITASQAGDDNYNAAIDVSHNLEVSFPTDVENPLSSDKDFRIYVSKEKIFIDALNDNWINKSCSVRIIGANGMLIQDSGAIQVNPGAPLLFEAPVKTGMYFIEIRSGMKKYTGKIMVN